MRGKGKEEGTVFNNEKRKKDGRKRKREREFVACPELVACCCCFCRKTFFLGPDLTNPLTFTDTLSLPK
jgi:hypothetical protein